MQIMTSSGPQLPTSNSHTSSANHEGQNVSDDVRNYLLVVATLIAAVTFQAGVNPPGGVWQDGEKAGWAIYASDKNAFFVFLTFNTLALSSSIVLIMKVTWPYPCFFEVVVATVSMVITYGASIFAITPRETELKFRYLLFTAAAPVLARAVVLVRKELLERRSGGQLGKW